MASLEIEKVTPDSEVGRIIHEEILNEVCKSYILVGKDQTCLAEEYLLFAESIKNFEVRNSDIWVASYPKTGTTWTQEMVWMIKNNLDVIGAAAPIQARFPFFEVSSIINVHKLAETANWNPLPEWFENSVEFSRKLENPRFLKAHLPFNLLPDEIQNRTKSPKIIYVWRNPKDTCVSYYHHSTIFGGCQTNLENFSKVFIDGKAQYGSFWKHVMGFWDRKNSHNILFLKYEDMKTDLRSVIKKVSDFLEVPLTEEKIERLCEHLSFESMKKNNSLNIVISGYAEKLKKHKISSQDGAFFRSGTVGKYKEELSLEMTKRLDAWTKQNIGGTSLECEYDYNL